MSTSIFSRLLKPFSPRDSHEPHRVSTSLELLFDLIFVVAIAAAGQQLHHSFIENHLVSGLVDYLKVFFALWWAWMNFTWFASAYDNDDFMYRIMTFVQITGSLIMAAGIIDEFQQHNLNVIIIGYVIMRLSLVAQWFRVARNDVERRTTALRYAIGIILVQMGWLLFTFSSIGFNVWLYLLLVLAELSIPIFAESNNRTPWHAHHIAERYSLLTIIVLGESIVGSYSAMVDALHNQMFSNELLFLMIGGLIMMFSMWWLYFDSSIADRLNSRKKAFIWGYGHFFIFISIAAVGASLATAIDVATGHAEISDQLAGYLVAISLVIYATSLWALHLSDQMSGLQKWIYPLTTIIVLCIPALVPNIGLSIFAISIVFAIRLIFMNKYVSQ